MGGEIVRISKVLEVEFLSLVNKEEVEHKGAGGGGGGSRRRIRVIGFRGWNFVVFMVT